MGAPLEDLFFFEGHHSMSPVIYFSLSCSS
jgi:hypothetical protein